MDLLLLVCLCLLTWSGTTFGETVTATEGSDVILPCFLNENLVPMVIIWEKEENLMKKLVFKYNNRRHSNNGLTGQDEEFEGRVFHFRDKLRDGNASIRIVNTTITDSGNYRCNIPGRKLFRIELVVDLILKDRRAENLPGKSEVKVAEDSVAILPCSLNNENLEQKEFVWKKDDQKVVFHYNNSQHSNNQLIDQDNNGRVLHFKDELEKGNASIKITSTKISDSGNYTCTIQGKQVSFITLSVDLILKDRRNENISGAITPPYIETFPPTDKGVKLLCKVQGASPQPDVQWQDSDGNTLTAEEPQVTTDGERYDVIVNVTVTNSDYYYCVATQKNIYHQVRSKTHVTVPDLKDPSGFKDWAAENLPGLKDPSDLFLKDRRAEISGAAPKPYVTNLGETKDGQLLQCEVRGASPQPDVQWQDSDGNNVTAEEPQVTTDGERYDVIINVKVTRTDTYRCVVTQKEIDHQTNSTTYVYIPEKLTGSTNTTWWLFVVGLFAGVVALCFVKKLRHRCTNRIRNRYKHRDSVTGINRSDPRYQLTELTELTTEAVTPERNQFISPPQAVDDKINGSDHRPSGNESNDSVLDMKTSDPRPQETELTTVAVTPERNQFISPPQGADVKINGSKPSTEPNTII